MKKIAYITLTIILILSFAVPIAANNLTNMRNDRNALSNRSTQQRRELNSIQNQMNALEFQMRMLDLDIEIAEQSYQHYTEWLEWAQRELDALEEELSRALIDYEEHMQRFADRIRHLNMTNTFGRNNLLLLLNSGNLNEIRNNLDLINTLAEHDRQLMDNLHMAQHVLAVRQQEVEDMQAEFEDLRYHQMRYYEELRATEEAKNALMYELGEREATLQASLDQYAADARALDAAIRAAEEELRRQQLANQPDGYMAWPIPSVPRSNITSPFNPNRLHPILRVRRPHNGIDLRAASGTPIVAAHDGVVTFSGVQGNFGNLVIIYHGGGISTLYAHNSRNLVSRGDTVTRGQRIALVGSTGLSTGPHLHFEVRRNNVPENPMPWLDGQNRP